jgi:hypothetical protein
VTPTAVMTTMTTTMMTTVVILPVGLTLLKKYWVTRCD